MELTPAILENIDVYWDGCLKTAAAGYRFFGYYGCCFVRENRILEIQSAVVGKYKDTDYVRLY